MLREDSYRAAERRLWETVAVTPVEQRVQLPNLALSVRIQEVGDGRPVLFIHGSSNSGTSWAGLVPHLDGFRALLLDRPGCGLSDPLPSSFADVASLEQFSERLVVDALDALHIHEADLVATSYGGYSALRTAAVHPERIGRIVLFGWTMGAANPALPWFMRLTGIAPLGRALAALPVNDRIVRSMFRRIGLKEAIASGRVSDEVVKCYTALLRDTDTMRNEIEIGRWNMTWRGLNDDVVLSDELLGRVQCAVYLLWGENDPFGPPDAARDFAARIPHATLELMPNAGHAVWLDDPRHAADVVMTFLNEARGLPPRHARDG